MAEAATTEKPVDQYVNWRRRLAGESLPTDDGAVDAGFYRGTSKDGSDVPIAYWYAADGSLRCKIGNDNVDEKRAYKTWTFVCTRPIPEPLYRHVRGGGAWPDQHPAALQWDLPEDVTEHERFEAAIESLAAAAREDAKKGPATSKEEGDAAGHLSRTLQKLCKRADDLRKAEKEPYLTKSREIDARWNRLIVLKAAQDELNKARIAPYLAAVKAENERKALAAAAEAERLRREAEEAQARAERAVDHHIAENGAPTELPPEIGNVSQQADEAMRAAADASANAQKLARATTTAGARGKGVSLRTVRKPMLTDIIAAMQWIGSNHPKIKEVVEEIGAAEWKRTGQCPAGFEIIEQQNVA